MAALHTTQRLDALEHYVNDVVVHAAKAVRTAKKDGHGTPLISHGEQIQKDYISFNSILDDFESELIRAKAVLQRDLDQQRAKRRPVVIPEPVMFPQSMSSSTPAAAPTPAMDPAAPVPAPQNQPSMVARGVPKQPTPPATAPRPAPSKPKAGGVPFPNMGIDPQQATPQVAAAKVKQEIPSPQMSTAAAASGPATTKAANKGPTSVVKTGSPPVIKAGSPVVKTASPALKTNPTPPIKTALANKSSVLPPPRTASSATNPSGAAKGAPKPTPTPPTGPQAAFAPPTASTKKAAPAQSLSPASAPQPAAPAAAVAPGPKPVDSFPEILDLTTPPATGPGSAPPGQTVPAPQLNFPDMHFSLAPPSGEVQNQSGNIDDDFDLNAFVADATNNILSDSFAVGGSSVVQVPGAAPGAGSGSGLHTGSLDISSISGDISMTGVPLSKAEADAMDSSIDELFRFDSAETGTGGEFVAGGTSDTLWIEDSDTNMGDTTMGEFDSTFFEL